MAGSRLANQAMIARHDLPGPEEPLSRRPHLHGDLRGSMVHLFVADLQTGFGPFVSVYLTRAEMDAGRHRPCLVAGGLVALAGQIPGGAWWIRRSERLVAGVAVVHRCQRARLCGLAIFRSSCLRDAARWRQLRARPGYCGNQSWSGRPRGPSANGLAAMPVRPPHPEMGCGAAMGASATFSRPLPCSSSPRLLSLSPDGTARHVGEGDRSERAHGGRKTARQPAGSEFANLLRSVRADPRGLFMLFHLANAAMLP